ncbi:MAG TPA: CPBP family intramembrane glutamic endopeptidase [Caulobacteraceae bacterium]|nr:CPBP family intramembrane glutamic endopeptidase [Caulobacteraceae bacterium]
MAALPTLLLALVLALLAWMVWRGQVRYAAFRQLTETDARQRVYRSLLLQSFVIFFGGSLAGQAALGDLDGLIRPPRAFLALIGQAQRLAPIGDLGPVLTGGLVSGVVFAVVIAVIAAQRTRGRLRPSRRNTGPLLPRNGAETVWAGLIATNAGVSEELFFRLLLPLLFTLVIGDAAAGFLAAATVFALVHLYQGLAGIVATFVLGLILTALYLVTGSLAGPIALHVALDLMALVVRPTLARRVAAG